jgi:hypothetical protein
VQLSKSISANPKSDALTMVSMAPTPFSLCSRQEGTKKHSRPQKMDEHNPQKPGKNVTRSVKSSNARLPPSPPAEKAAESCDQTGRASTGEWAQGTLNAQERQSMRQIESLRMFSLTV